MSSWKGKGTYMYVDEKDRTVEWYRKYIFPFLRTFGKFKFGIDIGCGNGRLEGELLKFCNRIIAIDYDENLLDFAKKYHYIGKIFYMNYGIKDILHLCEKGFDLVTFFGVFYVLSKSEKKTIKKFIDTKASEHATTMILEDHTYLSNHYTIEDLKSLFGDMIAHLELKTAGVPLTDVFVLRRG